jgi:putative SOS response-associated peptidase YedK
MCGRYASFLPPELIARLFGTKNPLPNLKPTWNMAPTMDAPVVRRHPDTGERHLNALIWGFIPAFTKTLKEARRPVNARAETVATSGMFGPAFVKRRCIVPAAAFYEWEARPTGKLPYAIARADGDPLAFAGVWEGWRSPEGNILRTFAIVTTNANAQMSSWKRPIGRNGWGNNPATPHAFCVPRPRASCACGKWTSELATSATTVRICSLLWRMTRALWRCMVTHETGLPRNWSLPMPAPI